MIKSQLISSFPPLDPQVKELLTQSGVDVHKVQLHISRRKLAARLHPQQVQQVSDFLNRQQRLGTISSAAAVIESLPETLLCEVEPQLKGLFSELKQHGFSANSLDILLANSTLDVLQLPASEVGPRITHLEQALLLKQHQVAAVVSSLPSLLLVSPAHLTATLAWLKATLGWSRPVARRHAALLCRPAPDLEGIATCVQSSLDCTTAELVLLLHLAPHLLLADITHVTHLLQHSRTPLDLAQAALSAHHPATAPRSAAPATSQGDPWQGGGAWDLRPMQPQADQYAAHREHLGLCALKLCSQHGVSLEELGVLLREKPTLLREVRL